MHSVIEVNGNAGLIESISKEKGAMGNLISTHAKELALVVEAETRVQLFNSAKLLDKDYPVVVVRGSLTAKSVLDQNQLTNLLSYENLAKVLQLFEINNDEESIMALVDKIKEKIIEIEANGKTRKQASIIFNKRFTDKLERFETEGSVLGFMDFIESL